MIVDGLYQGEDLDVAKKIKRVRSALLRSIIQSDCTAVRIKDTLRQIDSHRNELQKAVDHLSDIEEHFMGLCMSKKIKE
jgi:hypothetical protein